MYSRDESSNERKSFVLGPSGDPDWNPAFSPHELHRMGTFRSRRIKPLLLVTDKGRGVSLKCKSAVFASSRPLHKLPTCRGIGWIVYIAPFCAALAAFVIGNRDRLCAVLICAFGRAGLDQMVAGLGAAHILRDCIA